jgi:hypothetical protein
VEGGGALEAASHIDETSVTPAVPFGIQTFNVGSVESLRNPFTQAGGHPFEYSTELVLNYTPGDSGEVDVAGGGGEQVEVALPPGLIGNPQNAPRCPLEELLHPPPGAEKCPPDTAVGYTVVSAGGELEKGRVKIFAESFPEPTPPGFVAASPSFSSLVYNMEPTPGHVAALGFVVLSSGGNGGTPIVLEAKVRSDGDYGVTVGGVSPNKPRLVGVKVTTCEGGAQEKIGARALFFACKQASATSKPFLTNPTECTSPEPGVSAAPLTTAVVNAWNEPANFQRATVGTNLASGAASASSLMTGCDSLQFSAETGLDFRPSAPVEGGTSQADEPTGMTLNMKVPQTNEAAVNATPEIKNLKMKLPAGMTASPSAADGLQACSNAQFGLGTEFGPGSAHSEPPKPASCPLASQIGTVEVFTPLLSGAPTIEGVPSNGNALTCSPGMWSRGTWNANQTELEAEGLSFSYQWLRGGKPIPGATGNLFPATYTVVQAEDKGTAIQCQVTATNHAGSSVAVSRDVVVSPEPEPTPPFPPSSIAAPSGSASVGNALTCAQGAWTSSTGPAFKYGWLRGGVAIAGATARSYTLTPEDAGKVIQCQVTGENASGVVIADSAAVVVAPVPSPPPPLPGAPLQGQLFVGEPECGNANYPLEAKECSPEAAENGKLFRLFLQIQDPRDGLIVKLHGINRANVVTGQLESEFANNPQQPFELLKLKLKGGPRAPVANSQSCGPAVTVADLAPWSAPGLGGLTGEEAIRGTPDAIPSSQYSVDANGAGGACPGAWPFSPSFEAGTTGAGATTAGAFTQFSVTISRQDREQDLEGVQVRMPQGLSAMIASVPQCGEPQASLGTCGPESQIGTTTTGAGPGPDPFFVGGKVYLTGPYNGAPFGLSIVVPAVAGPFNLGNVVVRSAIFVDPHTAAATVTSDPLPQIRDGVPFRLRKVNVIINRAGFIFNPTNCNGQQVSATLGSAQGAVAQVSSPFGIGGCGSLPFHPELTAAAGGQGSKANGTSFIVRVKSSPGQANIAKTFLQLPAALPSRLTTIQKACVAAVFEANPATCPEGSNIGMAIAHTPVLKNPVVGPAYLVSHGNAAFPDVEFVLQGEGITLILDGKTDIKKGITYSRFETVPDAPVSTFETVLPAGPHSALTPYVPNGSYNLCKTSLAIPTEITGQNGALIKQNTHIALTGCSAGKATVKITKVQHQGNVLLVTVQTGAAGTVTISGSGVRTTRKHLAAGTHRIRVALTKTGRSMSKHHKKTTVRVSLTAGKQAVAKTAAVRL